MILILYSIQKFLILRGFDDTSIQQSLLLNVYDPDVSKSRELGFNVAFGLTYWEDPESFEIDPDYGYIEAYVRHYGYTEGTKVI